MPYNRPRKVRRGSFEFTPLERRLLMASTPASPRPETLGAVFDRGERQSILDRLTNLSSSQRSTLQTKLTASPTQFDNALAQIITSRTNARWYFDESNVDSYVNYLTNSSINYSVTVANATQVVDFHKFPEQGSTDGYNIDLPDNINWITPGGGTTNPEFLHELNRHAPFVEMAYAYHITGDNKFAEELSYQIASWSQQYLTGQVPTAYSESDKKGWTFDTALRLESWASAYFLMAGSPAFSGADSSLMIYKMVQMADYLASQAAITTNFTSNRTLSLAKHLLLMGQMFPELNTAAMYESTGRALLFKCQRAQLYNDGAHVEQSPTYTAAVSDDLLEARLLDKINGDDSHWTTDPDGGGPEKKPSTILSNAVSSYWQLLSPDTNRPAIGDTYRSVSVTLFLKANLIQGTTQWPSPKPRLRDLFLFGPDTINPFISNPSTPSLGDRGKSYALSDGGLFVMRSDSSSSANQIIMDAGSKGGIHGHFDLLNFELFGGGRPLIHDPGAYIYDPNDPDRQYVVSTRAHNTMSVDRANTGELEGLKNPSITVHEWNVNSGSGEGRFTASHQGYAHLNGSPLVTRTMWYNGDGTYILVDRVESNVSHNYQISFNLAGDASANTTGVQPDGSFRTRYASGGNVKVHSIYSSGGTVARGGLTFVTNQATGDYKDDAYRFTVTRDGVKQAVFVTLISAYTGTSVPDTSATLLTASPTAGGTVSVRLTQNGSTRDLSFAAPAVDRLNANAQTDGSYNDIAYDSTGRLHSVWFDRSDLRLKYAVRETDGSWSIPQSILNPVSTGFPGAYQFLSLALDSKGLPGVAIFDGWDGDLEFARIDSVTKAWTSETVESKGSVGVYPSLAFTRNDGQVITYYNRTKGDLMMALRQSTGYDIVTLDSTGDVGRFSSLMLDPNRPTSSKFAVAYEDTTNGRVKYAVQGDIGPGPIVNDYTQYIVDDMEISGGYISLNFFKSGSSDPARKFLPAVSYYDGSRSSLKFAFSVDNNFNFSNRTIATKRQGIYSNLFFTGANLDTINIYYYDRNLNKAKRYIGKLDHDQDLITGSAISVLADGGRELHVAQSPSGTIAYTNLNESIAALRTEFV